MPEPLGNTTYSVFIYGPESHKLHLEFEVTGRVATVTYDADLVTANTIDITVNGAAMATVTFNTDHDTTMDLIVAALEALSTVKKVQLTDSVNNRQLTIIPVLQTAEPVVTGAVTNGASQATTTVAYEDRKVYKGQPVKLTGWGEYVEPLASGDDPILCIGVSIHEHADGELITVAMRGYTVINAEADAALVAGPVKYAGYDTTNAANNVSGYNRFSGASVTYANHVGWALDDASAAGDAIRVVIKD